MNQDDRGRRFQEALLPHLSAAHNLARWQVGDAHDADDIVQDAYLRAFRFFDGLRDIDGRAWLLTIVRKRCDTRLRKRTATENMAEFDEQQHSRAPAAVVAVILICVRAPGRLGAWAARLRVQKLLRALPFVASRKNGKGANLMGLLD